MLVISRQAEQSFEIGDDIIVKILDVRKNGRVRIGIDAPDDRKILRTELTEPKTEDNHDDQSE